MDKPRSRRDALSATEQLQVISAILESFRSATEQADGKVSMLLVVHPGAAIMLATQAETIREATGAGDRVAVVIWSLLVIFASGFLIGGYHLAAALRPRVPPMGDTNRFAFPAVAVMGALDLTNASTVQLCTEAGIVAGVLARTARVKNHHVSAALGWIAVMVLAAAVCSALGAFR